jgi:succinate dehydrogenase/fumarate reductase-like Fe-S protein
MRLTIVRGPRPDGSTWDQTYDLPDLAGASVSNALQYISRHVDGSLGYYLSCRRGMCAACVVRIDGQNEMACVVPVCDGMVITPTKVQLLVKDTVVHLGMPRESEFDLSGAALRVPNPASNVGNCGNDKTTNFPAGP